MDPTHWVTPLEGLRTKFGDSLEIRYEPGYDNFVQPVPVEPDRFFHPDGKTQGLLTEFYNNLEFSGDPVLSRIDPLINTWWGGSGPASGIVDEKHFCVRWTGSFTPSDTGEIQFRLLNTGAAKVWFDGELILENHVGVRSNTAVDFDKMKDDTTLLLEKGKAYPIKAEFVSGLENPYALVCFLYKPAIGNNDVLIERAVKLAKCSDAALVVAGLPDLFESEGQDRPDMNLPGMQEELIRAIAAVNPNTVVAVNAGAPVAMPWEEVVDSILLLYYPGQEGGHALADIIFGDVNPSGKLPVSFPKRLEDNPAFIHYPGWKDVHYGERLFVGYRYYDTKDVAPLFPFGHGLSYTEFTYTEMTLPSEVKRDEDIKVSVTIENAGEFAGMETIQLYVRDKESTLIRPLKELKGFEKVYLQPGENQVVTFYLNLRSLSFYDPYQKAWIAENGVFEVLIGSSSRDIRLQGSFELVD